MRFPIPADTSLHQRLRLFEKYLEDKYQRTNAELKATSHDMDRRPILKAERAEVTIIQSTFRQLFDRELREP